MGIHPYAVAGYLLLFLSHATEILQELGFFGPILVQTTLTSIFNNQWLDPRSGMGFYVRPGRSQLDDEITFSVDSTSDVMRADQDRIVKDLLRYVFFLSRLGRSDKNPSRARSTCRLGQKLQFLEPALNIHWSGSAASSH